MPDIEQWHKYLSEDITRICQRPTMFGPDAEGLVLTQVQNWVFAQGLDPVEKMSDWRKHVHAAGYKMGCLAFLRDVLTNKHSYNMDPKAQFYEIEHIVGTLLASFAREHGLDVPDPTRRPDRDTAAPGTSASPEAST